VVLTIAGFIIAWFFFVPFWVFDTALYLLISRLLELLYLRIFQKKTYESYRRNDGLDDNSPWWHDETNPDQSPLAYDSLPCDFDCRANFAQYLSADLVLW
jgi:hypothetical protein